MEERRRRVRKERKIVLTVRAAGTGAEGKNRRKKYQYIIKVEKAGTLTTAAAAANEREERYCRIEYSPEQLKLGAHCMTSA